MTKLQAALYAVFVNPSLNLKGNTSLVVYSDHPFSDRKMQQLAAEINQPATTFLSPEKEGYRVKWFAPDAEIDLCGHGTAAAIVFLGEQAGDSNPILFSNIQTIKGSLIDKNFVFELEKIPVIEELPIEKPLQEGLGISVLKHYKTGNKNLVVTENEDDVQKMSPDFSKLRQMDHFGYIVTAPSKSYDFVSRTLVPHVKQLEDPATGSSHAVLATYWSEVLKRKKMMGVQLSERGGYFICEINKEKITLKGRSKSIFSGDLNIPD